MNRRNRILKLRRPKHPAKTAFRVSPGNLSLRSLCSLRLMENKFNHRERRAHKETRNHGFPFSGSKSETGATPVLLDGFPEPVERGLFHNGFCYPPSRHAFTLSRMPGTHGAVETRASSKPSWSTSFFFLRGIAMGQRVLYFTGFSCSTYALDDDSVSISCRMRRTS